MKRVLLVCVGIQDPFTQRDGERVEGPVLSFCRYLQEVEAYRRIYFPIQAIYLLSTADKPGSVSPTQENAVQTKAMLEEREWRAYHRPLDVLDPTDYRELTPAMTQVLQSIVQEWGSECEYLINVTPGTPQMQAVWISLYNAGLLPHATLLQVKRPQAEPDIEKRVRKVDITPLVTLNPTRGIYCNPETGQIWADGREVTWKLSSMQRKLVQVLWEKDGGVCTYDEIAVQLHDAGAGVTNASIRELVGRVREKIEPDPKNPRYILIVPGEGYRLEIPK